MTEPTGVLVCLDYAVGVKHPESVVEGSEKGWCCLCAAEVWISPTGRATIEELGVQPHCWDCTTSIMALDKHDAKVEITPQQRAEVQKHTGVADISPVVELANRIVEHEIKRKREK